jgi:nucleotide sugar dehydrogenase
MRIGVIGNGFVGKATSLLECKDIDLIVYDIVPEICRPIGTTLYDICKCDLVFISVPTPMNKNGSCHLNILKNVISDIRKIQNKLNIEHLIIVNRCTVPVGTSDDFNCNFMPEFLTEKNFKEDFINNPDWIFGLNQGKSKKTDELFKNKITNLINLSYKNNCIKSNKVHFVNNKEAEMIKLFRNNFLSTKIAFCNEIYEFSQLCGMNYETVRELATRDPRIGQSHTNVPGHDGKIGYGGTCFPKDTNNLLHQMKEKGMKSYIVKSTIERNEEVDRSEKDWNSNKGRAVID